MTYSINVTEYGVCLFNTEPQSYIDAMKALERITNRFNDPEIHRVTLYKITEYREVEEVR